MILRGIAGAVTLFLGRELSFLFSAAMAALLGIRLLPLLPASWPGWADLAFLAFLAILAAVLTLINKETSYYVCGFIVGGFAACEYFAPGVQTLPVFPFIIGAVLGTVILGVLGEWAMIIVSCAIGVYLLYGVIPLYGTAKILASAGIFIVGTLVQVTIFQSQKHVAR
jgi:hypothetical protein